MRRSPARIHQENDSPGIAFWIQLSTLIFCIFFAVSYVRNSCPTSDQSNINDTVLKFNERNARAHLQRVTSFGSRTAGSIANEILTPEYLRQVLTDIVKIANQSGMNASFDEQISAYSSFQSHFHVTSYKNLRNFVLRLHDPKSDNLLPSSKSFLVNCHYDSVVTSPGASDAFVSCAVMLEVSRIMAKGGIRMHNDLIFLFNGAEESTLPASHAFITQHHWAPDLAAFLNLEGAGAGGRMLVFQSGPGEASAILMDAYAMAFQQPYADVLAEVLFHSGLIPSDTDFRIFRDYGLIPGLDMAYTADGYTYHTPYDTESRIPVNCLQKTGEDIMNFLTAISADVRLSLLPKLVPSNNSLSSITDEQLLNVSSADILDLIRPVNKIVSMPSKRQVYFDVLGFRCLVLPWSMWKMLNWALCFAVTIRLLLSPRLSIGWLGLGLASISQLMGLISGFVFALLLGYLTHTYGSRMSWYSTRYNLVGLYVIPIVFWFVWFYTHVLRIPNGILTRFEWLSKLLARVHWIDDGSRKDATIERDYFDAGIALLAMQTFILSMLDSPAAYLSSIWLISCLLGRFIYTLINRSPSTTISSSQLLLCITPVLLFKHVYLSSIVLDFFIPIFGRSGHDAYPDILLSGCVFILMAPLFMFLAGPLQCTSASASKTIRILLLNSCLSYALLVHASPYGFPYSISSGAAVTDSSVSPRFQRVAIFHQDRRFHSFPDVDTVLESESFAFVLPLDVNGARYLTPDSYPKSVPSSLIALLKQPDSATLSSGAIYGGLSELVNVQPMRCNRSLPYCGIASVGAFLHRFRDFIQIPVTPHGANPRPSLQLISHDLATGFPGRQAWNLTWSVVAGPPNTHVVLRTNVPYVRLTNWSFHSANAVPMPIPIPRARNQEERAETGAHYFLYHVDSAEVNRTTSNWSTPWIFWITVDAPLGVSGTDVSIDIAAIGIYMDVNLPSSSSHPLRDILSRLPPWTVAMPACSSYDHYRIPLV